MTKCQHCLSDINVPDGSESEATIQVRGIWLCYEHYQRLWTFLFIGKTPSTFTRENDDDSRIANANHDG